MIFKTIFKNVKFELYVRMIMIVILVEDRRGHQPLEGELKKVLCELPVLGTERYMST